MRRAGLAILAVCALVAPTAAGGVEITRHERYLNPETHVREAFRYTVDVAPPDADDDGFANADDDCPHDGFTSNGGCTPEPPAPAPVASSPTSYSTGGYSIPSYIVACESGGDYGATNPSGAFGAYQIMPGTAANYGCDLSTAEGQDACAAEIYADVGSSAWVCG